MPVVLTFSNIASRLLLLICLLSLTYGMAAGQTADIKFSVITREQGLSNSSVNSILQDSEGFLWFGSEDGLNRYDGYHITVYKNNPDDARTISNNNIIQIFEDHRHRIWIATSYGVNLFDRKTGNFINYANQPGDPHSLSNNSVTSIFEDGFNRLWTGTVTGMNLFNEQQRNFDRYRDTTKEIDRRGGNNVTLMLRGLAGQFWFGTKGSGLRQVDMLNKKISYPENTKEWTVLNNAIISAMVQDQDHNYWIGTNGNGLFKYDPLRHSLKKIWQPFNEVVKALLCDSKGRIWLATENGGISISRRIMKPGGQIDYVFESVPAFNQKTPTSLFEDNQKNVWIGTHKGGIYKYSPKAYLFKYFTEGTPPNGLTYKDVRAFFEDEQQNIWIGTDGGGINLWNSNSRVTKVFRHDPADKGSIGSDAILDIMQDREGVIWVGTWGGGLNRYDRSSGKFTKYLNNPGDKSSIASNNVWRVMEDRRGELWVVTYYKGISIFDRKKNTFKKITVTGDGKSKVIGNYIVSLCEDSRGNIWLGTLDGGLNCISADRKKVSHYFNTGKDPNNNVRALFTDRRGRLWAGRNALYLFNYRTAKFELYPAEPAFSGDRIESITEDKRGDLWVSTNNGLLRFNPETHRLKRFTTSDGLQGLEFSVNASLRTRSGQLLFGGSQGFNLFSPDSIKSAIYHYPVYITDFLLFNKSVSHTYKNAPMDRAVTEADKLTLNYDQSDFSLEYAALNYVAPDKTQYAYRLKGFDPVWNYVGTQRRATYTNLNPGKYTFSVKASQPDGSWGAEAKSISITVRPPFWLTWWFKLLMFLALSGTAFMILYYRRRSELRTFNEQKKEEMHQMQLQFFTNISHEFRTPLTLILGTLEQILKKDAGSLFSRHYHTINRNANRLMHLISELMDFRKSESGSLKLKVMPGNFSLFLAEVAKEFEEQAVAQEASFTLKQTQEINSAWFDRQIIEKILLNLINNAFKYTPAKGKITVELLPSLENFVPEYSGSIAVKSENQAHEYIHLSITDNGIGISQESIGHLFERYFRVSDHHLGSGIGLAFVKSLTLLHKGNIYVYSEHQKGTQIIVSVPCGEQDYLPADLWPRQQESGIQLESIQYREIFQPKQAVVTVDTGTQKQADKPLILIVDDNEELRDYFREMLEPYYEIIEADNGLNGLQKSKDQSPALIISDIMMPVMDGLDFCLQAKEDFQTSHIPFILLTAKEALESRLEGVASGADHYFSKPVNTELLLLTIKNLFTQQRKIRERYLKDYQVAARDLVHSEKDKALMDKLLGIIEDKLEDPELNVDFVSREIGVSSSKLYKKIKDITGQSLVEFIRSVRLKKAMEIMIHEDVLITEVMYRVGMLSQSYFTNSFKKEFGVTPSQFQQQLAQKKQNN